LLLSRADLANPFGVQPEIILKRREDAGALRKVREAKERISIVRKAPRECVPPCMIYPNERFDVKRGVREAGHTNLNLSRGPKLRERAWPTSVDNTVSSSVCHALTQRSIRHERSNRMCEVFEIMRSRD
jgi:hypothetical protein